MRVAYRLIVVLYATAVLLGTFLPHGRALPPELRAWQEASDRENSKSLEDDHLTVFVTTVTIAFLSIHAASLIGLFLLRIWGLWLFAITLLLMMACVPVGGPYVNTGWEMLIDYATASGGGAILALGFCTSTLDK
jgi:hypothetical protein